MVASHLADKSCHSLVIRSAVNCQQHMFDTTWRGSSRWFACYYLTVYKLSRWLRTHGTESDQHEWPHLLLMTNRLNDIPRLADGMSDNSSSKSCSAPTPGVLSGSSRRRCRSRRWVWTSSEIASRLMSASRYFCLLQINANWTSSAFCRSAWQEF